ncbi:MAG: hypothetical protein IKB66_04340, partial [Clostridia bacterium]|nr:hypothetical protein [Clostridia bacterium]
KEIVVDDEDTDDDEIDVEDKEIDVDVEDTDDDEIDVEDEDTDDDEIDVEDEDEYSETELDEFQVEVEDSEQENVESETEESIEETIDILDNLIIPLPIEIEEQLDDVAEEPEEELAVIPEVVDEKQEVLMGIEEGTGLAIVARFKKSFKAKLIQSPDDTKRYYSVLKNALLSYKKTTSRISWNFDSINKGRLKLAKFTVRGKTLNLYLNLDVNDYAGTKYKVLKATSKKFKEVSLRYRITSERKLKYALDLIKDLADKHGLVLGKVSNQDFIYPFENTEVLVEQGLIKELLDKETYEEYLAKKIK